MTDSECVAALRELVVARKHAPRDALTQRQACVTARALRKSESELSWQMRRGLLARDRLASVELEIDGTEALIGRLRLEIDPPSIAEYEESVRYLKQFPPLPGQAGHSELDFAPVLSVGIDGLVREIQSRQAAASRETVETYQSFLYALEGLSLMIEHAAETTEAAMAGASPERRSELEAIARTCRHVAHDAPHSFRDAIQLLWFVLLGAMYGDDVLLLVPGHLDRTLGAFCEADLADGSLSREAVLLLVEDLYLLLNDYTPDGLAVSVMVGGRDESGGDVTNALSYFCLEALRRTKMIYPTVGICWHEGTPSDLVDLAIDLIAQGNPNPGFFGDETIQRGLRALGVPPDEACYYINSTCVEITPSRGSNVWVASPYFPTGRYLLDEIADEAESGNAAGGFEDFRERYFGRLGRHIAGAVATENASRRHRRVHGRKPVQSVFTRDCIGRGRDLEDGGARYNWVECSFVGLANLADALHVVREEVFRQGRLSLAELKPILDSDFEGNEAVRRRFLDGYAKYGQDCAEVDELFADTVSFVRQECAKHAMEPDGAAFVPGAFCWIMHEVLGRLCGATPDGRKAGFPFADGCGPAQGREKHGPTAAILSTTSWDHSPMIGGLAFNMKFNRAFFDSQNGYDALRNLILTFLRRGGFQTQVNVVDASTLRDARQRPEAYRDLIVRIGGYSDYFTRLSPEMQDEIIMRTEYTGV